MHRRAVTGGAAEWGATVSFEVPSRRVESCLVYLDGNGRDFGVVLTSSSGRPWRREDLLGVAASLEVGGATLFRVDAAHAASLWGELAVVPVFPPGEDLPLHLLSFAEVRCFVSLPAKPDGPAFECRFEYSGDGAWTYPDALNATLSRGRVTRIPTHEESPLLVTIVPGPERDPVRLSFLHGFMNADAWHAGGRERGG